LRPQIQLAFSPRELYFRQMSLTQNFLSHPDQFVRRHIGPNAAETSEMLALLGHKNLDELIDAAVPKKIRLAKKMNLPAARSEHDALGELKRIASENKVFRSFIGQGYYDTITPPVIQRNVLENPGWFTQYTPYQAEISQGRLEALLNFQTMVSELTALAIANASMLDEATAAAEAMTMSHRLKDGRNIFFVSETCHPQNIEVIQTRAKALGIEIVVGSHENFSFTEKVFGALVQYPDTFGAIHDYSGFAEKAHAAGAMLTVATDLLALTLIKPPGEFGADIAIGSAQRFGVPLGYGGPHAAFFHARRIQAPDARSHRRRLQRFARQTCFAPGARHARAAHPPRESHQQHLHRAGAAREHGLALCVLSWRRRFEENRGADSRVDTNSRGRIDKAGLQDFVAKLF